MEGKVIGTTKNKNKIKVENTGVYFFSGEFLSFSSFSLN